MSDYAKFSATLAKVNFNGKKTTVTLDLDNRSASNNIDFLMENIDEIVNVNLGDPQMKMDFPEEPRQGVTAKVDSSGVVESVESEDEGEQMEIDDDQGDEEPDYEGKAVLFNKGEEGQVVFPIEDGFARSPQITKAFGDKIYTHTMGAGEVEKVIGVRELPISQTGGKAGRYPINDLLAFGGELVDAPPEEGTDNDPGIPDENQAEQWVDQDLDFGDEEQAV